MYMYVSMLSIIFVLDVISLSIKVTIENNYNILFDTKTPKVFSFKILQLNKINIKNNIKSISILKMSKF